MGLLQIAGVVASPVGLEDLFLVNLRPDSFLLKFLTCCAWMVNLPLLLVSSVIGTMVFVQDCSDKACWPGDMMHMLFILFWILLSYIWLGVHIRLAATAVRTEIQ